MLQAPFWLTNLSCWHGSNLVAIWQNNHNFKKLIKSQAILKRIVKLWFCAPPTLDGVVKIVKKKKGHSLQPALVQWSWCWSEQTEANDQAPLPRSSQIWGLNQTSGLHVWSLHASVLAWAFFMNCCRLWELKTNLPENQMRIRLENGWMDRCSTSNGNHPPKWLLGGWYSKLK